MPPTRDEIHEWLTGEEAAMNDRSDFDAQSLGAYVDDLRRERDEAAALLRRIAGFSGGELSHEVWADLSTYVAEHPEHGP